ncbi:hypothetical protein BESB_025570 [Besnoitia besnoiti]|uniref:Transmembrane protein n=1 Tax=Besnoitia besnoiti TaxID=94643 RepID=A0A2A9M7E4_BESBE|nr:uncharacterized protein BESB_025570 [Besnoitia besnoiti]PFH31583.1 hypothetical protein BESB_025570 [Besnoitia besnoiti]
MRLTRWAYSLYQRISPNGSTGASSDLSESTSGSASPNLEGGNYDLSRTALSQTPSEVSQKKPRPASVAPDTNRGDKKNAERMHATGRESCRIPTAIYCVGLKTALQNEIVTGSSPHDSAEGHVAGVGLPNDSYLTSAGGAPAASYLLVAATSDAGENTAAYSREQGTVYVGRQPGTGHLALRHEERIQTAVDQHALGGAGESGWVTAQSELERSGRRRQSVGNLPKEAQRVVVPRRPLRVVGNGTGSGVCVDDSAFTVAVVENMTHFGETLNVKVPSSAVDFLLSNEAAVGDLPNQFQGEGSRATVLIPLRENATKPNAVKASSTAQRRRRTMERSNLENMVAPGDLVVLLCLRKGDAIFAVSADYTKMLSAESNGPWNEDVVVEKAWGSPQHSSATGFLLHVLIRAPERRDGVKTMNRVGTYQTGTSGKDFVVGSPLYFMKLRSLQVTHAVPYGVALGDLLQGSTCRILQVDEAQRAVRAKTKRIELACLQIPKNSPISRQKLQDLPANLGRQLRKVTAGALFTCLVGTAMAARGYSVAREPYLPALPLGRATALRDHPTTATRGRFSNAYLRWKDTTRKWYRRYRGWTDFRRAVFTAAQPETKRPGGGYILGAVGGKIMAYSAAIGLAAVTGIALNAVFGWWARRFDARRAVQARERLLLARQKERSQTLSARKAESESAALIIVYCSGLETELQQHLTTGANETDHVQT